MLEGAGWELKRIKGSHHVFKKPGQPLLITFLFTATKLSNPVS
jgi:predicted RNA binding protein YcfA (HicA-like mRNA interferase family)